MQTIYIYARMCTCSSYNYTVKTDRCISLETITNRQVYIVVPGENCWYRSHAFMISVNVTYGQKEKVPYDLAADHSVMTESQRERDDSCKRGGSMLKVSSLQPANEAKI